MYKNRLQDTKIVSADTSEQGNGFHRPTSKMIICCESSCNIVLTRTLLWMMIYWPLFYIGLRTRILRNSLYHQYRLCHPMLCIARPMPSYGVWTSICHVMHYVLTSRHILKFFNCLIEPPFWFFHTKHYGNILTETPLLEVCLEGGVWKIAFFKQSRFVSEMI